MELSKYDTIGGYYTWLNGLDTNHTQTHLNKAFGNTNWVEKWPNSCLVLLHGYINDHATLHITLVDHDCGSNPFRFYTSSLQISSFNEIFLKVWYVSVMGSPMHILQQKLKFAKDTLRGWESSEGNPKLKSKLVAIELHKLCNELESQPHDHNLKSWCS